MSSLPEEIQNHFLRTWHVAYAVTDSAARVIGCSGDFAFFGLDNPENGQQLEDAWPFLLGLFPEFGASLESFPVQIGAASPFRFEIFAEQDRYWILLFTTIEGDEELQTNMQRRNETLLIKEEQSRILQQLEAVNGRLRNFAMSTAHDLKSPAANTEALADVFLREYGELFDEEGRELLAMMTTSAQQMRALISDTLSLAIDRGGASAEVESVVVTPLLKSLAERIQGLHLDLPNPLPEVCVSRVQLERVLQNLLVNAVEASEEGDLVRVTCADDGSHWRFCVADSGSGIVPELRQSIFEQGVSSKGQLDSADRGLGLWIVKSLVEGWGGTVMVESDVGVGTQMFFTVPKELRR